MKVFVHTSSFTPKQQSEACYVSYLSQYPCPKHMGTTPEKAAGVLVPSWYRLISYIVFFCDTPREGSRSVCTRDGARREIRACRAGKRVAEVLA